MNLRDKIDIWFFSTADENIMSLPIEEMSLDEARRRAKVRGETGEGSLAMAETDHEVLREEVINNREMIHNARIRINRIDERTAFQSRILFGVFLALMISIAGGVITAILIFFIGI